MFQLLVVPHYTKGNYVLLVASCSAIIEADARKASLYPKLSQVLTKSNINQHNQNYLQKVHASHQ